MYSCKSLSCRLLLFLLVLFVSSLSQASDIESDEVLLSLKRLDRRIADRHIYKDQRRHKIDSLKHRLSLLKTLSDDYLHATMELGDSFNAFDNDTTIYYYTRGLQLSLSMGADSLTDQFLLKRAMFLPLAGKLSEALSDLSRVDTVGRPRELKMQYLESARQTYSYISSYHYGNPDESDYWQNLTLAVQKELLDFLDSNSDLYMLNYGEYLYYTRRYGEAQKVLEQLVDRLPEESNIYARAYHIMADIAHVSGETNRRINDLAISAAADVRAATLEVVSLQELGVYLYDHGDLERAYNYLSAALENAVECKASMRMLSISAALPIIGQAHAEQSRNARSLLTMVLAILAVLMFILISVLVYLKIQVNRKAVLQKRLEGTNKIKEVYLNQFMNLCSVYMDKLISFNKIVNRKISAGKVDDLYKMTNSGKFIEEQSSEFYEMFDRGFLHIYPSFVKSVNNLLLPDKQINVEENGKLNSDLRILAFMRLGMDDANRVAQLLNYSVNTIYAYRNRLKNRAINRDTFEEDIMKIKSI